MTGIERRHLVVLKAPPDNTERRHLTMQYGAIGWCRTEPFDGGKRRLLLEEYVLKPYYVCNKKV